jgi:hypothetical protein
MWERAEPVDLVPPPSIVVLQSSSSTSTGTVGLVLSGDVSEEQTEADPAHRLDATQVA